MNPASSSKYLSRAGLRGLDRLGDVYFPGDAELPPFSAAGVAEHVDVALDVLPEEDRDSLVMLLGIVGTLPGFVAGWLVRLAEFGPVAPGPIGVGLRFLRLGLKGVVTSLYYSGETGSSFRGPSPLDVIGYRVGVYTADVDQREVHAPLDQGSVAACRDLGP